MKKLVSGFLQIGMTIMHNVFLVFTFDKKTEKEAANLHMKALNNPENQKNAKNN